MSGRGQESGDVPEDFRYLRSAMLDSHAGKARSGAREFEWKSRFCELGISDLSCRCLLLWRMESRF